MWKYDEALHLAFIKEVATISVRQERERLSERESCGRYSSCCQKEVLVKRFVADLFHFLVHMVHVE